MFYVKKRLEVSAAHYLALDYPSKCENLHGHNWYVTVYCKSENLDANGMVIDFGKIKDTVMQFDHGVLNDNLPANPTAENIAWYLCSVIPYCYQVDVEESSGNTAIYKVEE